MPKNANWFNLKYAGNAKVAALWKQINDDPFSSCFFLSSLYDRKKSELMDSHPQYFPKPASHEIRALREELILVNMYSHIKRIQQYGLRSIVSERTDLGI